LKSLLIILLISISTYILFFKTEKYESSSTVIVKDLSENQSTSPLGAMLLTAGSGVSQDAMLLDVYIKSSDMFELLDTEFKLRDYYSGIKIDIYNRLHEDIFLISREMNDINLLARYNSDLKLLFDEPSSTLSIKFAHADAKVAQQVLVSIIKHATTMLNNMDKKSSTIVLRFLKELEKEKYELFLASLKKLLAYQNKHNSISPKIEIETKSNILATLEGDLVQKKVAYQGKLQYMNKNSPEMKILKGNISHIMNSIKKIKQQMTGESRNRRELNKDLAEFGLLESEMEFNKEIYKQTLMKLEESSVMVNQNTKNLIVVSVAKVANSYSYPNKFKDIMTTIILLSLLYGIGGLVSSIVRDHKD
jgi:capsular polysaccharide transport system permease protein